MVWVGGDTNIRNRLVPVFPSTGHPSRLRGGTDLGGSSLEHRMVSVPFPPLFLFVTGLSMFTQGRDVYSVSVLINGAPCEGVEKTTR